MAMSFWIECTCLFNSLDITCSVLVLQNTMPVHWFHAVQLTVWNSDYIACIDLLNCKSFFLYFLFNMNLPALCATLCWLLRSWQYNKLDRLPIVRRWKCTLELHRFSRFFLGLLVAATKIYPQIKFHEYFKATNHNHVRIYSQKIHNKFFVKPFLLKASIVMSQKRQ